MKIRQMAIAATVGLSLASAPVMAQTSWVARSVPTMEEANAQNGSSTTTYVIAFFVIVALGLGIYAATDSGNEGRTSP